MNNDNLGFYGQLGLESNASTEEIKLAYKKKLSKLRTEYADKTMEESDEAFDTIRIPYLVLSQSNWRAKYDVLKNHSLIDKEGLLIPPEYPETFNRKGLCWPGLFLSAFWSYSKGLPNAWMYLVAWFIGSGFLGGFWCLFMGYKEYSKFINENSPEKVISNQRIGSWCTIRIIIVLVILFILRVALEFASY